MGYAVSTASERYAASARCVGPVQRLPRSTRRKVDGAQPVATATGSDPRVRSRCASASRSCSERAFRMGEGYIVQAKCASVSRVSTVDFLWCVKFTKPCILSGKLA